MLISYDATVRTYPTENRKTRPTDFTPELSMACKRLITNAEDEECGHIQTDSARPLQLITTSSLAHFQILHKERE